MINGRIAYRYNSAFHFHSHGWSENGRIISSTLGYCVFYAFSTGSGLVMFTCAVCLKAIGPKIRPVRVVTGTRPTTYHNEFYREDEWGNKEKKEVDSTGSEITGEEMFCPADARQAGYDVRNETPSVIVVGRSFEEIQAAPIRAKLIAQIVNNAVDRVNHGTVRGDRDSMVAIPLIKWFVENNKDYQF